MLIKTIINSADAYVSRKPIATITSIKSIIRKLAPPTKRPKPIPVARAEMTPSPPSIHATIFKIAATVLSAGHFVSRSCVEVGDIAPIAGDAAATPGYGPDHPGALEGDIDGGEPAPGSFE